MRIGIVLALLAGAIGLGVFQHFQIATLKTENEQLRAQASAVTEESKIPKPLAEAPASDADAAKMAELLRLRSEVGILRRATNELALLRAKFDTLQKEKQQLQWALSGYTKVATNVVANAFPPKAQWAFAGYQTPESALQSFLWSMTQGDLKTVAASLTPEAAENFTADMQRKPEGAAEIQRKSTNVSELSLLERRAVTDTEVILKTRVVLRDGREEVQEIPFRLIGTEWKVALGAPTKAQP